MQIPKFIPTIGPVAMAFLIVLLAPSSLFGCKCYEGTIASGYRGSELIVHGEVVAIKIASLEDVVADTDGGRAFLKKINGSMAFRPYKGLYEIATVRVFNVVKGSISGDTTFIYTPRNGAACGFKFELGGQYTIFSSGADFFSGLYPAFRRDPSLREPNLFYTSHCHQTTGYYKKVVAELSALKKAEQTEAYKISMRVLRTRNLLPTRRPLNTRVDTTTYQLLFATVDDDLVTTTSSQTPVHVKLSLTRNSGGVEVDFISSDDGGATHRGTIYLGYSESRLVYLNHSVVSGVD